MNKNLTCLYTKQHYVVDLPAGAALGGFVFAIFHAVYQALPGMP